MALRRVLNFALDTISFFFETWRIVVHRLGKPGRGELKGKYISFKSITNLLSIKKFENIVVKLTVSLPMFVTLCF